ncbi:hypothetical protein FOYG_04519 [Fusarium oxysporum NRRL 32931]|uniref:Cytochrome P450 oxidoreductase n=1 Tax=Fusarium oxysporum NRRL 32931 TaxID=660029 RepID=W9ISJ1_FUSOX|nr:hypothetical protein FOYG_04519 [Fusarium oxysporum NRRL 32931]
MGLILVTALGLLPVLLIYRYIIYPVFFCALSRLPAPHWICHISPLWILAARKWRRENTSLYRAHQRFGPVIRIGPNEVSVDGLEGMRTIYQGGFEKGHWYSVFDNYGVPNMFATGNSKHHSLRKRMISNVYSKSYIQSSQASKLQMAEILVTRLLPTLDGSLKDSRKSISTDYNDVEVFGLYLATAMDLITAYIFGLSNATNFIADEPYRREWQDMYLARANYPFWTQEVPKLTNFCKRWIPWLKLYPQWVDQSNKNLSDWNWELCENVRKTSKVKRIPGNSQDIKFSDEPVVYNSLLAGIDREFKTNGEKSILYSTSILQRDRAIASEVMDHSLAGQETAGIALTYATWHISKSPELQRQLHAEVQSLKPSLMTDPKAASVITNTSAFPDPKEVDSLPLLHAIVTETLRLHAPIPGPQPRQTPKNGCSIGGYYIPGDVRIASLAYTLHRDKEVFPEPGEWNPERWVEEKTRKSPEDEVKHREMQRVFWAFGSGGRMCVGSNFAMNEMKFILAFIYANFETSIVDDEGIEQEDAYTARPIGEKLVIRFTPLKT